MINLTVNNNNNNNTMINLAVNIFRKTGSETGTVIYANAWLFKNGVNTDSINNIMIDETIAEKLELYSANLKQNPNHYTFEFIKSELESIAKHISKVDKLKKDATRLKSVAFAFKAIDHNYWISNKLMYGDIEIPETIVEVMLNAQNEKEFLAIHRFYLKCMSNPNPESVKDLFAFIQKSKLIITASGNFVTFRRVATVQQPISEDLYIAISYAYSRCMFSGGDVKNTFCVIKDDRIVYDENSTTSIYDLHNSITSLEGKYTDNHSRKYDYRIGKNYKEKNYDSDHNNLCSRGLHSGSFDYIETMKLGDQIVYCIVNPMHVVAVADNATKVRSSELYLAGTIKEEEWFDFKAQLNSGVVDFDIVDEEFEKDYVGKTIEYNSVDTSINNFDLFSESELALQYSDEEEDEDDSWDEEYDDNEDEEFCNWGDDEEEAEDDEQDVIEEAKSEVEKAYEKYLKSMEFYRTKLNFKN